tara:strand:+ start:19256 stop:19546 length:291 start_codon:yes stop_codon:yes gene_type:complete
VESFLTTIRKNHTAFYLVLLSEYYRHTANSSHFHTFCQFAAGIFYNIDTFELKPLANLIREFYPAHLFVCFSEPFLFHQTFEAYPGNIPVRIDWNI